MNRDELELVARAVATGAHSLEERLGEDVPEVLHPAEVLAGIDSDEEFDEVARDWIADAEAEVERRRSIIDSEVEKRLRRTG